MALKLGRFTAKELLWHIRHTPTSRVENSTLFFTGICNIKPFTAVIIAVL
jgi:hypothetical protein